jgi:hypothetical protein
MLVRDIDLMDAIADLFGKHQFMKGKTAPYLVQWNVGRLHQGRDCASNGAIVFSELHDPV